jgi:PKD repeat protein
LTLDSVPAEGNITAISAPDAAISLVLDDGSVENAYGWNSTTSAYQFMWFNRFTPAATEFPFMLTQIGVYIPSWAYAAVGDEIDLVVYEDTDGNPANGGDWLKTIPVTLKTAPGYNVFDISTDAVVLNGPGDVFIGVIDRWVESGVTPRNWPAAIDETTDKGRSWSAGWSGDPPDPALLPTDDTYDTVAGNWAIRGYGETTIPATITVTFNVTVTAESGYITNTVSLKYGGDPFTADHLLHVGYPPEVTFTSNTPVMLGEAAVFTPTVTGTSPFEYLWNFGDTITSTLPSPTHTYEAANTYTVTLTVTSGWGTDTYAAAFMVKADVYLPLMYRASSP